MREDCMIFTGVTLPEAIRISGEYKRLADLCKVGIRRVYKWSTGEIPIPTDHAETIRRALQVTPGGTAPVLREIADLLDQHAQANEDGKISILEAAAICEQVKRAMYRLELEAREMERRAGV